MRKTFFNGDYVKHPLLKNIFLRKDLAVDFFRIECFGVRTPQKGDENLNLVTQKIEETRRLGSSSTLKRAIIEARECVHSYLYCVRPLSGGGVDDFHPEVIYIYDRDDKLVLTGLAKRGGGCPIDWLIPITNDSLTQIQQEINDFELDYKATILKGFVTEVSYRESVASFLLNSWFTCTKYKGAKSFFRLSN